jgi:hypothetical protein
MSLWAAVDELVARAPRLDDVAAHGLHLFAARQARASGNPVPAALEQEERAAALRTLAVEPLLRRVRAAYDGPLLLIKGPQAASRYPDPTLRPFADVDLVALDAAEAHRALLAAGFVPVGEEERYEDIHHLRPLVWPELPLPVELHDRPKWLDGLGAPSAKELFAVAVPAAYGEGVLALPPAHHAVLLAVHSWAHAPLRRLLDLVDVAAAETPDAAAVAADWGVSRLWRTTAAAADHLFGCGPRPFPLRLWARSLAECRERTVVENHLARWTSAFWARSTGDAFRLGVAAIVDDLRPEGAEGWSAKLARMRSALQAASTRLSEHEARAAVGEPPPSPTPVRR